MSSSRRGRHAEKSLAAETLEAASTVVEIVDGTEDVVTPVSDDDDLGPLASIETASPPCDVLAITSGNSLTFCVTYKPFLD